MATAFACTVAMAALSGGSAQAQGLWSNDADSDYYYGNSGRYDRGYNGDRAYYGDDEPFYEPAPRIRRQPQHTKRAHPPKSRAAVIPATKPQGPVIIAISIDNQHLKIYDANGLFAESPVSTGMRGHSTPMGAFSVIQKNKWHRSNIYSGAPMPYMQRITWSGIALHAGVLPGYPASHGCIRMPNSFAMRMWGWTRMGARVVITPGDVTPTDFTHPSLMTKKPVPVAAAPEAAPKPVETPQPSPTPQADKTEIIKIAASDTDARRELQTLELRMTSIAGKATPTAADDKTAVSSTTNSTEAAKPTEAPAAVPADKPAALVVKRTGHIAAFISRKTGRLYVRQNFEPLFDVPVTITGDRPLGTHIFTMRADKENAGDFRWSVVSLPAPAKHAHRKKATEAAVSDEAPSSPSEALDRIVIPDDAKQQLAEMMAPGASLTVSDQGLGDETGRGTDFIVPLR
jgi:lipoprotein-anchoring transpeptidase ErfK/SrfK